MPGTVPSWEHTNDTGRTAHLSCVVSYDTRSVARQRYCRFIREGCTQGSRDDRSGGGLVRSDSAAASPCRPDGRCAGSGERSIRRKAAAPGLRRSSNAARAREYARDHHATRGFRSRNARKRLMQMPGKDPLSVRARSLRCSWAVRVLGLTQAALARRLGLSFSGCHLVRQARTRTGGTAWVCIGTSSEKLRN